MQFTEQQRVAAGIDSIEFVVVDNFVMDAISKPIIVVIIEEMLIIVVVIMGRITAIVVARRVIK